MVLLCKSYRTGHIYFYMSILFKKSVKPFSDQEGNKFLLNYFWKSLRNLKNNVTHCVELAGQMCGNLPPLAGFNT